MKQVLFTTLLLFTFTRCAPGADGRTCTVTRLEPSAATPQGGSAISCPDGTSSVLLNGNAFEVKQLCPNKPAPNGFMEYYIKVGTNDYAILDTGSAMGVYLTLLLPNKVYGTSDGAGCTFMVYPDGTIGGGGN
jgi:hypothetical protein